jgi:hypothetical protein
VTPDPASAPARASRARIRRPTVTEALGHMGAAHCMAGSEFMDRRSLALQLERLDLLRNTIGASRKMPSWLASGSSSRRISRYLSAVA